MRRKLLLVAQGQNILQRDWDAVCEQGFAAMQCGFRMLTPRGFAALAAPRVTAAEFWLLKTLEHRGQFILNTTSPQQMAARWRTFDRLCERGWVEANLTPGNIGVDLTPAGTTALNNIRAASGSPEWKP
jgi:hypothetical protein